MPENSDSYDYYYYKNFMYIFRLVLNIVLLKRLIHFSILFIYHYLFSLKEIQNSIINCVLNIAFNKTIDSNS